MASAHSDPRAAASAFPSLDGLEGVVPPAALSWVERLGDADDSVRLRDRAIAASAIGIVITDHRRADQPITYVNPAFERITGYSSAEMIGRNCRLLHATDRDQPGIQVIRTAVSQGREGHAELRNYRRCGTMFWNELFVAPIRDSAGEITHYIGVQHDITARKHAEDEARRHAGQLEEALQRLHALDRLRSNFFGLVSHELRTPLSSIVGFAEFLEDDVAGDLTDQQRAFVAEIQAGARRLAGLVDDLLDFARLEAGTFRLIPREGDLREKVREVVGSLAPQASKKRIALALELPDEPIYMCADHPRIGQVIINLVHNAIKFTPENGRVTVTMACDPRQVRIAVADTGIGIAAQHQVRLFDKFYQVEPTTTRAQGGAGLGLSIAKALVEAHGGAIDLDSAPGSGACFWLTLPRTGIDTERAAAWGEPQ